VKLFSVVIPARDEAESLPATIEHLHLEFSLNQVPHEIVVVDDGSQDRAWEVLQQLQAKIPGLRPIQNTGEHGFGRAVVSGRCTSLRTSHRLRPFGKTSGAVGGLRMLRFFAGNFFWGYSNRLWLNRV
jgi:cellulose synthase/poly-beta-1,6-N-acetylglucosamine synthase-like glycosyltransferase